MKKFLLIVTDGADSQISGIQHLLNSLFSNAAVVSKHWSISILTTEHIDRETLPHNAFPGAHIKSFALGKSIDKYYIKFLLPKFIAAHCHADDLILYLDYDHICWSDFQLPPLAHNTIYLSSEIHPLENILTRSVLDSAFFLARLSLHYNTSLIYTTAEVLMKMADQWASCYLELSTYISSRYLEEVSFSFAALKNHITLKPIQSKIQSNWENIHQDAGLFHYGGEHRYSGLIKGLLSANGRGELIENNAAAVSFQEKAIFDKICSAFSEYRPLI
jgi:hypothetical protein